VQSEAERHDRLLCQISGNQGELVQRRRMQVFNDLGGDYVSRSDFAESSGLSFFSQEMFHS
jgi:hypothetical protein